MNRRLAFLICVEAGPLEQQSVLFARSIRKWAGDFASSPIHAYVPRQGRSPGLGTRLRLRGLDVTLHTEPLNTEHPEYPFANKIYASAAAERELDADVLAFCDTDTIFLSEPGAFDLPEGIDVAATPAYRVNKGSTGPGHRNEGYWQRLYELAGVTDPPWVETMEKGKRIRGYWNAGLVVTRRDSGVMGDWLETFQLLLDKGHLPRRSVVVTDQISLAAAMSRRPGRILNLDYPYNYDIVRRPFFADERMKGADLADLIQVHYHLWFNRRNLLVDLRPKLRRDTPQYRWLRRRLPLKPAISEPLPGLEARGEKRQMKKLRGSGKAYRATLESAHPTRREPVPFIVGVARSGTTLLRLMLDAHPELAIPPETYLVPNVIDACLEDPSPENVAEVFTAHRRWADFGLDADELRGRLGAYEQLTAGEALRTFYRLYAEGQGKPRWGDKTPAYLTSVAMIEQALPEARFIHIIRDGRDVALSIQGMRPEDRPPRGDSTGEIAEQWRRRIKRGRSQARKVGHYLEVRYEDLVADTEPVLRRICEFLELDFNRAMLLYHEDAQRRLGDIDVPGRDELAAQASEERAAVHALTSSPPQTERVGAWRTEMTPAARAEFEQAAGDLLRKLGYQTDGPANERSALQGEGGGDI